MPAEKVVAFVLGYVPDLPKAWARLRGLVRRLRRCPLSEPGAQFARRRSGGSLPSQASAINVSSRFVALVASSLLQEILQQMGACAWPSWPLGWERAPQPPWRKRYGWWCMLMHVDARWYRLTPADARIK
jgi:hypothetical protein